MPTLKQLQCSVKCPDNDLTLSEHGAAYADGQVNCFLRVPDERTHFCIQLKSQGYIAPGLAVFVYIDGVYACNRNRRNLRFAKPGDPASVEEVDFTVRQLERFQDDGRLWGRPWAFKRIPDEEIERARLKVETTSSNRTWGAIEVIVLRCHGQDEPRDILSAFGPPPDSAILSLKSQKGMWKFVCDDQGLDLYEGAHTKQNTPLGFDGADDRCDNQSPQKRSPASEKRSESRRPRSKARSARDISPTQSKMKLPTDKQISRDGENNKRSKDGSYVFAKDSHARNGRFLKKEDASGINPKEQVSQIKAERSVPFARQRNATPPPFFRWDDDAAQSRGPSRNILYEWDDPPAATQLPQDNPIFKWWNGDKTPSHQSNLYSAAYPEPLQGSWNNEPVGYNSMIGVLQSESPVQMSHDEHLPIPDTQSKSVDKNLSHYVAKQYPARYTHSLAKPTYIDSLNAPYARFVFKYRNKATIEEALNIVIDDFEAVAKRECESKTREDLIAELVAEKKHAKQLRQEKEQAEEAVKVKDTAKFINLPDVDEHGLLQTSLGKKIDHFIGQLEGKFGDFPWAKKNEAPDVQGDGGGPSNFNNAPPGWAQERNPRDDDKTDNAPAFGGSPANTNANDWGNSEHQGWDTKANTNQNPQWGGSSDRKAQDTKEETIKSGTGWGGQSNHREQDTKEHVEPGTGWGGHSNHRERDERENVQPSTGWGGHSNHKEQDKKENAEPSSKWANNDWPSSRNEGKDSGFQTNRSQEQPGYSKPPNTQEDGGWSNQSQSNAYWSKPKSSPNRGANDQRSPRRAIEWVDPSNTDPPSISQGKKSLVEPKATDKRAPEVVEGGPSFKNAPNEQRSSSKPTAGKRRELEQNWNSSWRNSEKQDKRLPSPVQFKGNNLERASRSDHDRGRGRDRSQAPGHNNRGGWEDTKTADPKAENAQPRLPSPSADEHSTFWGPQPAGSTPEQSKPAPPPYTSAPGAHQNNSYTSPQSTVHNPGPAKDDSTGSVPGAWPTEPEAKDNGKEKEKEKEKEQQQAFTFTGVMHHDADDITSKISSVAVPRSPPKDVEDANRNLNWGWPGGKKGEKWKGRGREENQQEEKGEEKAWGEGWNASPCKQDQGQGQEWGEAGGEKDAGDKGWGEGNGGGGGGGDAGAQGGEKW